MLAFADDVVKICLQIIFQLDMKGLVNFITHTHKKKRHGGAQTGLSWNDGTMVTRD